MAGKVTLGKAIFELHLDNTKFNAKAKQSQMALNRVKNAANTLGNVMMAGLVTGIAATTAAFTKLYVEAGKTGAQFEQSIKTVSAIMGATDGSDKSLKAMQSLSDEARRLGSQTAYTATQAGDAMQNLARAGLSANEIIGSSGPALMLAGASASSMSAATDLMASSMKQFGMGADQATRMTDAFTVVQQRTLMDMEHLTSAMRYGGTIASQMGMNVEETSAALGLFRDLGVEGSTAGTQFRQAMIQLAAPTRKAEKTLKKYNIELSSVNPEVQSFDQIMRTLGESGMTLGEMSAVVGKRAAGSIQTLSKEFADGTTKFHALTEEMYSGAGTTEKTYNSMMDTVKGRFSIMSSAFQEFQLNMFDSFKAPLKELIGTDDNSGLTGIINGISETMKMTAGEMANGPLQQGMQDLTDFFNQNQAEIAANIIIFIENVIEAGAEFIKMIPVIMEAAELLFKMWAVATVLSWIQTITLAVSALWRMVAATRAARAAMLAFQASRGIFGAISLAAGAIAAAMLDTADETRKATDQANRLTAAFEGAERAKKDFANQSLRTSGVDAGTAVGGEAGEGYSGLRRSAMAQLGAKGLGKQEKEIIRLSKQYAGMGEEARRAAIANGEMITIFTEGRTIAVKYADALKFKGMKEATQFQKNFSETHKDTKVALRNTEREIRNSRKAYNQLEHNVKMAKGTQNDYMLMAVQSDLNQMGYNVSLDQGAHSFDELMKKVKKVRTEQAKLRKEQELYTNKLNNLTVQESHYGQAVSETAAAEAAAAKRKEIEPEKKPTGPKIDWKQRRRDAENANKATLQMEENLQREIDAIRAEGSLEMAHSLQDELKEKRKLYDEEIKLMKKAKGRRGISAKQKLEIETRYVNSVLKVYERMNAELGIQRKNRSEEIEKDLKAELQTRAEQIQESVDDGIKERKKEYDAEVATAKEAYKQIKQANTDLLESHGTVARGITTEDREIIFRYVDEGQVGAIASIEDVEKAIDELSQKADTMDLMDVDKSDFIAKGLSEQFKALSPEELDKLHSAQEDYAHAWSEFYALEQDIHKNAEKEAKKQARKSLKDAIKGVKTPDEFKGNRRDFRKSVEKDLFKKAFDQIKSDMIVARADEFADATPSQDTIDQMVGLQFLDMKTIDQFEAFFKRRGDIFDHNQRRELMAAVLHSQNMKEIETSRQKDDENIKAIGRAKLTKLETDFLNKQAQERLSVGIQAPLKLLELEQKLAMERMKQDGASKSVLAAQAIIDKAKRVALQEELIAELVNPYGEYTDQINELEMKSVTAFSDGAKEKARSQAEFLKKLAALAKKRQEVEKRTEGLSAEERRKALQRVDDEVARTTQAYKENGEETEKWSDKARAQIEKVKNALSTILAPIAKIGSALSSAALEGFSFITGGALSTNISGFLNDGVNAAITGAEKAKEELKKLEEQLEQGKITQEQFDEQVATAGGTGDPAQAASQAIVDKFEKAIQFAETLAAGAPTILQKVAEQIPILIDSLLKSIPTIIDGIAENLPSLISKFIDGIIELAPTVINSIIQAVPNLVDAIVEIMGTKIPNLLNSLSPLIDSLIQTFISQLPKIIQGLTSFIPTIVSGLMSAFTALIDALPQVIAILSASLPQIIGSILEGVKSSISALLDAAVLMVSEIIKALPEMLPQLVNLAVDFIRHLVKIIPTFVTGIIDLIPSVIDAVLQALPDIIIALSNAIPNIIMGLVEAIPVLIESVIKFIPELIVAIVKNIPAIAMSLVQAIFSHVFVHIPIFSIKLVGAILSGIAKGITAIGEAISSAFFGVIDFFKNLPSSMAEAIGAAWVNMVQFLKDAVTEFVTLGVAETESFGDTPEAIKAGANGMIARFAPNDLIVAAQNPMELLKQSLDAVGSGFNKIASSPSNQMIPPPPMSGGGSSAPLDLTIMAEGRVLDEVQISAMERGHAPRMKQKFKKAAGVDVGFSRGRYNRFSGTRG